MYSNVTRSIAIKALATSTLDLIGDDVFQMPTRILKLGRELTILRIYSISIYDNPDLNGAYAANAAGNAFGRSCLCVCLSVSHSVSACPVRALTFESLDLETSF